MYLRKLVKRINHTNQKPYFNLNFPQEISQIITENEYTHARIVPTINYEGPHADCYTVTFIKKALIK